MTVTPKGTTILEVLDRLENCTRLGARFVTPKETETFFPYGEVVRRARCAAAKLQEAGLVKGDRVAIILRSSIDFFDAFLGTLLAGGIPTALYPPVRLGRLNEYFVRLQRLLNKIGCRFLITESRIKRLLGSGVTGVASLEKVLEAENLAADALRWSPVTLASDEIAFLQFSSGSTVEPKAVVMTHENLLYNLAMMEHALPYKDESEVDDGAVCWLPLYHDMGLVGCLFLGLYYPATVTYLGPEAFLSQPALWLRTMSRFRAVISPAPNFAYSLCLNKIRDEELQGVDLSRWRAALNGAEPIDADTINRFSERFARWGFRREAITPVYGLAEAGLAVSFSELDRAPLVSEFDRDALAAEGRAEPGQGRCIASVGRALPGVEIKILDDQGQAVATNRVGRIWIKGPSVMDAYYEDPELTANIIRDGWLDTGDLGFFFGGELYIAGRLKDLIIIRGRNYAPQEVEELLVNVEGLRSGCAAALGAVVESVGEQLIILAERSHRSQRPEKDLIADIKSRVLAGLSLVPYHVEILDPGTLPRTSSGKLRRSEALRQFLAGELVPPEKVGPLKLLIHIGKSQLAWASFRSEKH